MTSRVSILPGSRSKRKMAIKPAGQWNSCDITLLGRKVTVILNDEMIINNIEIPGITGGALDSREGQSQVHSCCKGIMVLFASGIFS
jgi:hypothetical protein